MSNNKQTSLDWYMEAMNQYFEDASVHCGLSKDDSIYEQAKALHKQEILDAWEDGQGSFPTRNEEQYYTETFGREEMTMTSNNKNNNPVTPKPNNPIQASDEMDSRLAIEKKLWDAMVEWDKNNKR
jgi:hypothetical protein